MQHLVVLVAAPVGAGHAEQLEGADLARVVDVRATAQVHEVAVAVGGQDGRRGRNRLSILAFAPGQKPIDELQLVRLIA